MPRSPRRGASSVFLTPLTIFLAVAFAVSFMTGEASAQRRRPAARRAAGRNAAGAVTGRAVVIDERLAVLRSEPSLTAPLLQRLSHGREVTITGARQGGDGVTFYRVNVTRNTNGWMQAESLASPRRAGDDERLLRLARASEGFERIERLRLHLEMFPRSPARPQALLLLGNAGSAAAERLTRDARRNLTTAEMEANPAPAYSYMLNFRGLDRYARQGVGFTYDKTANRFLYDGALWREIIRRYPQAPEAAEARSRLDRLSAASTPAPTAPVAPR